MVGSLGSTGSVGLASPPAAMMRAREEAKASMRGRP